MLKEYVGKKNRMMLISSTCNRTDEIFLLNKKIKKVILKLVVLIILNTANIMIIIAIMYCIYCHNFPLKYKFGPIKAS